MIKMKKKPIFLRQKFFKYRGYMPVEFLHFLNFARKSTHFLKNSNAIDFKYFKLKNTQSFNNKFAAKH